MYWWRRRLLRRSRKVAQGRAGRASLRVCGAAESVAMLDARTAHLKSQLTVKGAIRPKSKMQKMMPTGATELKEMPRRRDFAEGEAGMAAWCNEVDERSEKFRKAQRALLTSEEHDRYMWTFNNYLIREGFGSFVERTDELEGGVLRVARRTSSTGLLPKCY